MKILKYLSLLLLLSLLPNTASAVTELTDNGIRYYIYYDSEYGYYAKVVSNKYSGAIVIPQSVTHNPHIYKVLKIGSSAFYGCTGLTSVIIPNSVTTIDGSAFCGCTGLTSVTIPNSVTTIGEYNQEIKGETNVVVIPVNG